MMNMAAIKESLEQNRIDPMGPLIGLRQLAKASIMMPMNEIGDLAH